MFPRRRLYISGSPFVKAESLRAPKMKEEKCHIYGRGNKNNKLRRQIQTTLIASIYYWYRVEFIPTGVANATSRSRPIRRADGMPSACGLEWEFIAQEQRFHDN